MEPDIGPARGATPIDRELMPVRLEIPEPVDASSRAVRDDVIGMPEPIARGQPRRQAEPGAAELIELIAGSTSQAIDPMSKPLQRSSVMEVSKRLVGHSMLSCLRCGQKTPLLSSKLGKDNLMTHSTPPDRCSNTITLL